jgi:preprotein translocase subunit YajC
LDPPTRHIDEEISVAMNVTTLLAAAAAPSGTAAFFFNVFPLVLVFIIFWFLMIRPQQKRMKEHQARIAAVKKGDRVVTGGGLIGKVTKVGDSEVEVELGQGIRVTAVKSTLTQVIDPTAAKPAND